MTRWLYVRSFARVCVADRRLPLECRGFLSVWCEWVRAYVTYVSVGCAWTRRMCRSRVLSTPYHTHTNCFIQPSYLVLIARVCACWPRCSGGNAMQQRRTAGMTMFAFVSKTRQYIVVRQLMAATFANVECRNRLRSNKQDKSTSTRMANANFSVWVSHVIRLHCIYFLRMRIRVGISLSAR